MLVSVHAAKTNLSRLLEAVERGDKVVITRHGAPVAELVPVKTRRVRIGRLKGQVHPPPEALFAPMNDEELRDWGAL
jgi:prevent-host-death family protein